uniref:hypothetical protein n=1 Tax=Algoriphagus sp. TaxID=1872435 RepID=UPI004048986D
MLYFQAMHRRPFLQKISLISTGILTLPFASYGQVTIPKATRLILWAGHFGGSWGNPFPSYRVCEVGEDGKAVTYLKTVKDGLVLNSHPL